MRGLAGPETNARWATQRNGTIVILEVGTLVKKMLSHRRHVVEAVELGILVIGEDKITFRRDNSTLCVRSNVDASKTRMASAKICMMMSVAAADTSWREA